MAFKFTDCAGNISYDTICFTAHLPLPDLTHPQFWKTTATTDCHDRCTDWTITDTLNGFTSIDRGVDSIVVVSNTNMTVTGATGQYPVGTKSATLHICVTDSMKDGMIVLRAATPQRTRSTIRSNIARRLILMRLPFRRLMIKIPGMCM